MSTSFSYNTGEGRGTGYKNVRNLTVNKCMHNSIDLISSVPQTMKDTIQTESLSHNPHQSDPAAVRKKGTSVHSDPAGWGRFRQKEFKVDWG